MRGYILDDKNDEGGGGEMGAHTGLDMVDMSGEQGSTESGEMGKRGIVWGGGVEKVSQQRGLCGGYGKTRVGEKVEKRGAVVSWGNRWGGSV